MKYQGAVKFVQDGTRNEIIAANREVYSCKIKELLDKNGIHYHCIDGDYMERFTKSKELIHEILKIDTEW